MNVGMIISGLLHLGLLLLVAVGLPDSKREFPEVIVPTALEMVDIDDVTEAPKPLVEKSQPKPKPAADPPKKEEKKRSPPKPAEPEPKPQIKPEPNDAIIPAKPEIKPEITPNLEPTLEIKPKTKTAESVPKPYTKPKPPLVQMADKKTKPKKDQDDFDSILKNLDEQKSSAEKEIQQTTKTVQESVTQQMTVSELEAVRNQIQGQWTIPAGAKEAGNLAIEIKVKVNPNRTVLNAKIIDNYRMKSDPFYRAAAESALRAVMFFQSIPLELPSEKYEQWKEMVISFNPKEVLG